MISLLRKKTCVLDIHWLQFITMFSSNDVKNSIEDDELISLEKRESFEAFLSHLWEKYKVNLTNYKRQSLMRRVGQRMKLVGISTYKDYIEYLEAHPEESTALFEFILVNYTCFFRDVETWDYIATNIIPDILAQKKSDDLIKVWSAGCASGEEVYTLAILLIEALGVEEFNQQVRIYERISIQKLSNLLVRADTLKIKLWKFLRLSESNTLKKSIKTISSARNYGSQSSLSRETCLTMRLSLKWTCWCVAIL